MSNTLILADEGLLSRLKEFIIKEISYTHTLKDDSESTRPKHPMRHLAPGILRPWNTEEDVFQLVVRGFMVDYGGESGIWVSGEADRGS